MDVIIEAILDALRLLFSVDQSLLEIIGLTLMVTSSGLFFASVIGFPLGILFGLRAKLPGAGCLVPLIYTGMGLPPVVVGLVVYLFLSNRGPLGAWRLLFTPSAMVVAQTIIALPLIIGLTIAALKSLPESLSHQLRSLGATPVQMSITMLLEARAGLFAAIVAAFGSIISEVGAVILVGGNIEGETRVLTTAIVLETRKGNFGLALALGLVLLLLAFGANALLYALQKKGIER